MSERMDVWLGNGKVRRRVDMSQAERDYYDNDPNAYVRDFEGKCLSCGSEDCDTMCDWDEEYRL